MNNDKLTLDKLKLKLDNKNITGQWKTDFGQ